MNNWSMEQFCRELNSYLKENNEGLETEVSRIMSVDGKDYMGLILKKEGMNASPVLNLNDTWHRYMQGLGLKEIMDAIMAQVDKLPEMQAEVQNLMDYEKVKNRLFIRVSNADWDKEVLEVVPHRQVADLALTCHIQVGENASTMVTDSLLANYGITAEQLFDDAFKNTVLLKPAKIMDFEDALQELSAEMGEEGDGSRISLKLVTNTERVNGASVLFYPGVMERIQRAIGDYYVLPSSRHEVLIHPKVSGVDPKGLAEMVRDINREVVSKEDRLSDHVYLYQAETGKLTLAGI